MIDGDCRYETTLKPKRIFFYREDSINIAQNIKKKRNVKRKGEENTKIQRGEFNVVTKDGGETTKEACLKRKNKNSVNHPPIPSHVHQKIKIDSVQKSREPKTVVG